MIRAIPQPLLDRLFRVGIILKGIDGILELVGGLIFLVIPLDPIQDLLSWASYYEIQTGNHAFIGNYIAQVGRELDPHTQLFAALYLIIQGGIKIMLVMALIRRQYHLYPVAMVFILAFIFYFSYRIGYDHSVLLGVLTLFDLVVVWLTYQEWIRHRDRPTPT